jgi:hypothetical protein
MGKHCSSHCPEESGEVCRNDRINSDVVIHCNNLLIRQDFCVDAIVGVTPPEDGGTIQQLIENTIIKYTPGVSFPNAPIRLMTVIARNLSTNFVDVAIQRATPSDSLPPINLTNVTVQPNSEVALSAPNANQLVASAEVSSRVRFFVTVFYPNDPVAPNDPV